MPVMRDDLSADVIPSRYSPGSNPRTTEEDFCANDSVTIDYALFGIRQFPYALQSLFVARYDIGSTIVSYTRSIHLRETVGLCKICELVSLAFPYFCKINKNMKIKDIQICDRQSDHYIIGRYDSIIYFLPTLC